MRAPDKQGVWRAWRLKLEPEKGQLAGWLLHCPGAHVAWEYWLISLAHLRDSEGVPPATRNYPEAAYELCSLALNPDYVPDPDDFKQRGLLPYDLVEQFHGVDDNKAAMLVESLVDWCVAGKLSPDSDYARTWKALLWNSIEHLTTGHPVGQA